MILSCRGSSNLGLRIIPLIRLFAGEKVPCVFRGSYARSSHRWSWRRSRRHTSRWHSTQPPLVHVHIHRPKTLFDPGSRRYIPHRTSRFQLHLKILFIMMLNSRNRLILYRLSLGWNTLRWPHRKTVLDVLLLRRGGLIRPPTWLRALVSSSGFLDPFQGTFLFPRG